MNLFFRGSTIEVSVEIWITINLVLVLPEITWNQAAKIISMLQEHMAIEIWHVILLLWVVLEKGREFSVGREMTRRYIVRRVANIS